MHPPISDYGLIGDCETAALVAANGSVDWLCWPRFDSGACFAALLGRPDHGHWGIRPAGQINNVRRRYRGDTLVLETIFQTQDAEVALIDFMPLRRDETQSSQLVRLVEGRRGRCNAGYRHEAEAWSDWLLRAVAGSAKQIQPLYGVAGEHRHDEHELPWLPGYRDSRPVRTGNGAYDQLQLDVFGSVMDTLHESARFGLNLREASAGLQRELMRRLEQVWRLPDEGLWEVRGEPRHFVHSKLMCWVAFDRAVSSAEHFGLQGPVDRWRRLREEIKAEVLERGFDEKIGAFVQSYGSQNLDAAVLLIPIVGFLPADDPRVVSTTCVVERDLAEDGLLLRYRTGSGVDGLSGEEGAFLACSFWLADNMILQGRHEDARRLFERLLALRNDVGLLAEQYDFNDQQLVGNFPQAFSHFALIDTAFNFAGLRGVAVEEGAEGNIQESS